MKKLFANGFIGSALLIALLVADKSLAVDFVVQDHKLQQCLENIAKQKQWQKPEQFIEIKCHSGGIESLAGLELFYNVQSLSLYNNQLQSIDFDLNKLPQLKKLNLARNNLEQLTIAGLAHLQSVYMFANRLTEFHIANLKSLQILKANNNQLERFSYANTPELKKIYIFNNQLETINIYDLPALHYMDCRENPMPDELYDEMDQMRGITFLHDGNAEDW